MTSQQTVPQTVEFSTERSTSLRFASHADGITTLGFRSQKTGAPTSDYDYPDPTGEYYGRLIGAERPGTYFRRALRAGEFPAHIDKRPAVAAVAPVQSAIIIEMPGFDGTTAPIVRAEQPKADERPLEVVRGEAVSLSQRALSARISNHGELQSVVEIGSALRDMQKVIRGKHEKSIKAADAAHKAALETRNSDLRPLERAQEFVDGLIVGWDNEQKRLATEAAARQREEDARRQREENDRRRREHERQVSEAIAIAEAKRLESEAELEAKVEEAEASGASVVEVEAILAQAQEEAPLPVFVPPPPPMVAIVPRTPPPPPAKVVGLSIPRTWVGTLEDKDKLSFLTWVVAQGEQYLSLVDINQAKLNGLGKTTNGKMAIPGVTWEHKANARIAR